MNPTYSALGSAFDSIDFAVTDVDFSNPDDVDNMTAFLNTYVVRANDYNVYEIALLAWSGKNEKNGPVFTDDIIFIVGDISGDGKLSAIDYLMLKKIIFGTMKIDELADSDNGFAIFDVTGNGQINASDYFKLKSLIFAQ